MAAYYQQAQPAAPQPAYLSTSAGVIPFNPAAANAGTAMGGSMGGSMGGGMGSTGLGTSMNAGVAGSGFAQQPMAQYYAPGTTYNQAALGAGASPFQAQGAVPQALTGTQPGAIASMVPTAGLGAGASAGRSLAGGAAVAIPAAARGVPNPTAVNAAANEGAAEGAAEEEEAEEDDIGSCWACCGPAAEPGGPAEAAAGGPVGPSAAAAPGPAGPAGPAGERVVQYFKSGYNSAAAGANVGNGLPANIAAAPAARSNAQAI